MATSEIDVIGEHETERVIQWRAQELARAGYGEHDALRLALRADVDLHLAIELLRQGCPSATALRILI